MTLTIQVVLTDSYEEDYKILLLFKVENKTLAF